MAMLTVIMLLFSANFYFLLTQVRRQAWKSGFFWMSITALSMFLFAFGHAIL